MYYANNQNVIQQKYHEQIFQKNTEAFNHKYAITPSIIKKKSQEQRFLNEYIKHRQTHSDVASQLSQAPS